MFKRVLVANRGEIAVRVIRALHEVDIEAGAVYSTPDPDGLHARPDGFTSLAVVAGAAGVAAGLPWADPVIGLLIAVAILGVLRSAVAQVGARLMDAVDPHLVQTGREAVATVDVEHLTGDPT